MFVSLSGGVPLSVTRIVTTFVLGPCGSVGVHAIAPPPVMPSDGELLHPKRIGKSEDIGTDKDPMVGKKAGGVNVFGGGLALYSQQGGKIVGGLGVSGDTSCADHNIAWKVRDLLALDRVPAGVAGTGRDNIIYDLAVDTVTRATSYCAPG